MMSGGNWWRANDIVVIRHHNCGSEPAKVSVSNPSLGLSPAVIKDIYAVLPCIRDEGVSIVVVEQDIDMALKAADEIYCFMHGRVTLRGVPSQLRKDAISAAYFGLEER